MAAKEQQALSYTCSRCKVVLNFKLEQEPRDLGWTHWVCHSKTPGEQIFRLCPECTSDAHSFMTCLESFDAVPLKVSDVY